MAASSSPPTVPRAWAATILAGGFALLALTLRVLIHAALSTAVDTDGYRLGCLQGVGNDFLLGILVFSPLLVTKKSAARWLACGLSAVAFFGYAAAAHYHCVFNRMPGWESVGMLAHLGPLRASLAREAPLWLLVVEVGTPTLLLVLLARGLARCPPHLVPKERASRWSLAGAALFALISPAQLPVLRGQEFHGCAGPYGYLLSTAQLRHEVGELSAEEVEWVQERLGVPLSPPQQRAWEPRATVQGTPRSIIMLVLESVGTRELYAEHQGTTLMPNLRRLTEEALYFPNHYAPGTRSRTAMVSMFTGLTPNTERNLLTQPFPSYMHGFPEDLKRAGYATVYAHGGDLSYENQRDFLRMVGFDVLLEPDPEKDTYEGWSQPDEQVYARLRTWIESYRARKGAKGLYLAAVATMSSHHPYVVPSSFSHSLPEDTTFDHFAASLLYADEALGSFLAWYREHEAPRGTVLIVTGDHAPLLDHPNDPPVGSTGEREFRYRVPLIVAGLAPDERDRVEGFKTRQGGHHNLPQTILGLVGLEGPSAFQGVDLLDGSRPWRPRFVISVGGEEMQLLTVHDGDHRWVVNTEGEVRLYGPDDPNSERDLYHPSIEADMVREFARKYRILSAKLVSGEPAPRRPLYPARPLPRVTTPLLVSHRGNTLGSGLGPRENSLAALEAAIAAGFRWMEIDVRATHDEVPVVWHDPVVRVGDELHLVRELSLKELRALPLPHPLPTLREFLEAWAGRIGLCVEIKPCFYRQRGLRHARAIIRELKRVPEGHRSFIVDSFDRAVLSTVGSFTPFATGFDFPQRPVQLSWLDFAAAKEFSWVYVRGDIGSPDLVRAAHERGLRVMLYDVNDRTAFEAHYGDELPDGIMTDVAEPWRDMLVGD